MEKEVEEIVKKMGEVAKEGECHSAGFTQFKGTKDIKGVKVDYYIKPKDSPLLSLI